MVYDTSLPFPYKSIRLFYFTLPVDDESCQCVVGDNVTEDSRHVVDGTSELAERPSPSDQGRGQHAAAAARLQTVAGDQAEQQPRPRDAGR